MDIGTKLGVMMSQLPRPICRRCGGKLDFMYDPETGRVEWLCNNATKDSSVLTTMRTDEEHYKAWANLTGDEVAHLEDTLDEVAEWGSAPIECNEDWTVVDPRIVEWNKEQSAHLRARLASVEPSKPKE